jgi:hypothetical protein
MRAWKEALEACPRGEDHPPVDPDNQDAHDEHGTQDPYEHVDYELVENPGPDPQAGRSVLSWAYVLPAVA